MRCLLKMPPRPMSRLLLMLLLSVVTHTEADKRKSVTFLKVKTLFNPYFVQNFSVQLTQNRTSLDILLNVARNVEHDIWLNIVVAVRELKRRNFRTLLNYNVNLCSLMGKPSNQYLNLPYYWMNNVHKYGNLTKVCPMKKGNYYWHDFRVERFSAPSFLISGKYRSQCGFYIRRGLATCPSIPLTNSTLYALFK